MTDEGVCLCVPCHGALGVLRVWSSRNLRPLIIALFFLLLFFPFSSVFFCFFFFHFSLLFSFLITCSFGDLPTNRGRREEGGAKQSLISAISLTIFISLLFFNLPFSFFPFFPFFLFPPFLSPFSSAPLFVLAHFFGPQFRDDFPCFFRG